MKYRENKEVSYKILGIDLHVFYYDYHPKKPVVIFLHGLRNDTLKMKPLIDLIKPYYNVIAFDFPGHGKSKDCGHFDNYLDYGAEVTIALIKQLQIDCNDCVMVGGSFGANVIINMMLQDSSLQFKKIGLMAPLYSQDTLAIKAFKKAVILKFAKLMARNGIAAKVAQRVIDNDKLFTLLVKLLVEKPYTDEHIEHEKRLWRISPIEIWGASVYDTLNVDNSTITKVFTNDNVTFIYPLADQYLDIDQVESGYKTIFPNAKFERYNSKRHMPKGNFGKNKAFMDSVKKIILESLE